MQQYQSILLLDTEELVVIHAVIVFDSVTMDISSITISSFPITFARTTIHTCEIQRQAIAEELVAVLTSEHLTTNLSTRGHTGEDTLAY